MSNTLSDFELSFIEYFGPADNRRLFRSAEDLDDQVKLYQKQTGMLFRIRSTIRANSPAITRRIYHCIKTSYAHRTSAGLRNKPSCTTGCRAFININHCRGWYRVTKYSLEHNHVIDPILAKYEPVNRRLTASEFQYIVPWLMQGTDSYNICQVIRNKFDKRVCTQDIINMRQKLFGRCRSPLFLIEQARKLNARGNCVCIINSDNYVTHFIHMTLEQKLMCQRYPEVIGIDATYKTCKENYFLFQIVVVDSCGVGMPVCFGFLNSESTDCIKIFLRTFKSFVGDIPIKTIISDDSAAIQAAVSAELPTANHILCRVHLLRSLVKRVRQSTCIPI